MTADKDPLPLFELRRTLDSDRVKKKKLDRFDRMTQASRLQDSGGLFAVVPRARFYCSDLPEDSKPLRGQMIL